MGCYHFSKEMKWVKVACLSEEYVRSHYPHPELEPGVQFGRSTTATTSHMPVTGGAVDVGLTTLGPENDLKWGKGYFSVQLNTNSFIDSNNHTAEVQFVDQHKATSPTQSEDLACIWNVDITAQLYPTTCHPVIHGRAVQSGDFVAIQGYQDFQASGYLKMIFQLSWDSQEGTYGIVAPDLNGLTKAPNRLGNWKQLSGSILGYGGSSMANFTQTNLWIAIDAWNCEYGSNMDCIALDPGPWTWASTTPFVALSPSTGETNNLKPAAGYTSSTPSSTLPALQCPGWNGCYIEYEATAP
jgi:hypothetical protein